MCTSWQLIILSLLTTVVRGSTDYMKIFSDILSSLNTIELQLDHVRDFDHPFVKFLVHQEICAIKITELKVIRRRENLRHCCRVYENIAKLNEGLSELNNHGGFYLLVLVQLPTDAELLQFGAELWKRHDHNRVYYLVNEIRVLLYNPFQHSLVLAEDEPQAYAKMYNNLNGYILTAYIFDSVYSEVFGDPDKQQVERVIGADANVATTIAKHLNFQLYYQWPDDEFFGGRMENGSFSGALGRVHRQELDIIFAGFFIKDYLTQRIEFTASVYTDELCLFVQKAKRIPQSIVPLFAVNFDVWLCFIVVGLISAGTWFCIRCINLGLRIRQINNDANEGRNDERWLISIWMAARIFIDTWIVWVRVNLGKFPPFHSERIFVASLCLVSVIFWALFESSLATVYIRPMYYRDISTLQDLDDSQLPIYIKHPAFRDDLFYGHDSSIYQRLDAKMKLVGEGEERLIRMVAARGKFAGVTRAASLEINDIRYVMTQKIYKIPECPKNYNIAYILKRHSPYLEALNVALLRIVAAGLVNLWTGETKERAKWSIHEYPEYLVELGSGRWKVLTISDVQLAFYALFIGCLLATVVHIIEWIWSFIFK